MSKRNSRKGFTIVELVIVIAVIGILTAILIPTFMNLTKSAEASSQKSFLKNVNTQLAVREADPKIGGNPTMYDALAASREYGFDIEKVTPFDDNDIIWDSVANRFAMVTTDFDPANPNADASKIIYSDGNFKGKGIELWHVYDQMPDTQKYSIYARAGWTGTATPSVTVGFDAGQHEGFTSITYQRGVMEAPQTAVIRTNSSDTTLTVNAPNDTVKHYDRLGKLVLSAIAYDCFEEYGKTAYAEASLGKIIAKTGGEVTALYATEAKVSAEMDGGTIVNAFCVSTTEAEALDTGYTNFSNSKDGNVTFQYVDENHNPLTPAVIEEAGTAAIEEAKSIEEAEAIEGPMFWEQCVEGVSFYGGKGQENDPYLISSATQLALMASNINNGTELTAEQQAAGYHDYYGAYYKIIANLDLSKFAWTPIGSKDAKPFSGYIDGNNKKITGMTNGDYHGEITENEYTHHIGETYGFIGFTKDVVSVKNLTLSDVSVEYDNAKICGGLIGYTKPGSGSTSSLTITGVNVDGEIKGYDKVAGLVGYLYNVPSLTVENCTVGGTLSLTNYTSTKDNKTVKGYRAGGLFGYVSISSSTKAEVNNCTVSANINTGDSTADYFWLGAITSGYNSGTGMSFQSFKFTGTITGHNLKGYVKAKDGDKKDNVYVSYADLLDSNEIPFIGNIGTAGEIWWCPEEHVFNNTTKKVSPQNVVDAIIGVSPNYFSYHLTTPAADEEGRYSFKIVGTYFAASFGGGDTTLSANYKNLNNNNTQYTVSVNLSNGAISDNAATSVITSGNTEISAEYTYYDMFKEILQNNFIAEID